MCGIAGIVTFDGAPVTPDRVDRMLQVMRHRGQDGTGVVCGPTLGDRSFSGVGLGHRRLAVIDLSPAAAQPMGGADAGVWITYNGEIYNFVELRDELRARGVTFRTSSDTEVVLEAYRTWGEDCVTRLSGMFAFAVWDVARRRLFCARDPLGIKPFYYRRYNGQFLFASESRALVDAGHALAPAAVTAYLLCTFVPGTLSIYDGVERLPPGSTLVVESDGTLRQARYWRPSTPAASVVAPDLPAVMTRTLDAAVDRQMRSDVPVGALLSGGFDSGMVVASAARAGAALHTYSVGFDGGHQVDERPVARALAARYGTIHHERVVTQRDVPELLRRVIDALSEPVADSAIVPTFALSEMAAADGVKVLLSGTGGDEVFAGYPRYVGHSVARRVLLRLPAAVRAGLARVVPGVAGARLRYRNLDMALNTAGAIRLAAATMPTPDAWSRYLQRLAQDVLPVPVSGLPELYVHMHADLQGYLPDLLLSTLDQVTMAHTIEGRVPLLDTAVVDASLALPPDQHLSAGQTKRLMRRMAADRLMPETFTASKQGFSGPVVGWVDAHRDWFRDRSFAVRAVPGCEGLPIEALWREEAPAAVRAHQVFLTAVLATWYHDRVH